MRTDLEPDDAVEAMRSFEEIRAAMLATVWRQPPAPSNRVEVIALRSRLEFLAFAQDKTVYALHVRTRPFPPVIVTSGNLRGEDVQYLVHELAHSLSWWFLPTQPTWYAEGLATYLETLRFDRRGQRVRIGEPSIPRLLQLRYGGIMPAATLLGKSHPDAELVAAAWLLVHYLLDKRPREFAELQFRLALLQPSKLAWSAVLPDLPLDRLDDDLRRYQRAGRFLGVETPVPIVPPAVETRTMSDADVHATRAYLHRAANVREVDLRGVQAEVSEALATDAANVAALAIQFFWLTRTEDRGARAELARRVTAAHPDSWLAWVMTAEAAEDEAAKTTALARALAIAPDTPEALSRLAVLDSVHGHWAEGVSLSKKAMQLGVRSTDLLSAHVQGLAHTGRCADAELLSTLLAGSLAGQEADEVRAEWAALAKVCAATSESQPNDAR